LLSEPAWLTPEGVIRLNARLMAKTGEPHGLLSREGLESACAKPHNHWAYGESDPAVLACELLFGIARNHPFQQGNKRTAFAAMIGFLRANGYAFTGADGVEWADDMIAVIDGSLSQETFADRLRGALSEA